MAMIEARPEEAPGGAKREVAAAMAEDPRFWDRIARKYAASPVRNLPAYEATLDRVRSHLKPGDRVLEVGCGTGTTALKLADAVAHLTASDLSPGMIAIAKEKLAAAAVTNVAFTVAPVDETRFEAESFDAVLGFNILHLVPDLATAIARARGLLRPGGLYITKTPCLGDMGLHIRLAVPVMRLFGKAPHALVFGADELQRQMRAAGFEIVETRTFEGAPKTRFLVARKT